MRKNGKARLAEYTVLRGFTPIVDGKELDSAVEPGGELPQGLTSTQLARLVERGVIEKQVPQETASREATDG